MTYTVTFAKKARKQVLSFERSGNEALCRKIDNLLLELAEHPREGTGKPEMLKGNYAGYWSRRIDREHRLVYAIDDDIVTVTVISAKGHYE